MERINRLRQKAIHSSLNKEEFFYYFYKTYVESPDECMENRYAEAFYQAITSITPVISPDELIVGKQCTPLTEVQRAAWHEKYEPVMNDIVFHTRWGQDSHMAIDYDLVLNEGLNGILGKIDGYLATCKPQQVAFYKACQRCLQGVIRHAENYAAEAERQASETENPVRKGELFQIAAACRAVPANPAKTFYEAVQSVNFITHCLSANPCRPCTQQFQLGHPDRYLLPFYEKDLKNGAITKEGAQLLLNCLGIQINERVPSGVSCGYMVGGRDQKGNIVANDLTELCMQVVDDIRLVYPAVGLCYTEGMDERYVEKACEILSHGCSHPAVFGDDIITKGLLSYGVPQHQACNYIHSTCVEITPVAASNVWVASPYTNLAQVLLDEMETDHKTFADLINGVYARLDRLIDENCKHQNVLRAMRAEKSMNPLLSCFVNDCLAKGLDIERGGATYNWIMPSFVGMANLVDSLYAIKELVYDRKELTLQQFKEIVDTDFAENEVLRLRIANTIPKYGNDIDEIDDYYGQITGHIIEACKKHQAMHQNGKLIPSVFCWVKHEQFGSVTSATPDGRKAGFPLGDGSGPCHGREQNGPTASILSSTKWDHSPLIGGVAVNMKFAKKSLEPNSVETMKNLVLTYLKRGGLEMQINVVDKETLEQARKTPELYQDLVVRIGGYSDYFVRLSDNMQKEVLLRTEHNL
ncbi:MAG: hypothetical protein IKU10_01630 [Clostridia bacterium]|nr:hypothetical protein [Clostridia bacterium]